MHYSAVNISCTICISPLSPSITFRGIFFSFWPAGSAEEVGELGSGPRRSSREETPIQADLLEHLVQFAPLTGRSSVALLRRPQHSAATRRPTSKCASSSFSFSEITARNRIGNLGETTATMLRIIWWLRGSHLIWKQFASSSLSIFSVRVFTGSSACSSHIMWKPSVVRKNTAKSPESLYDSSCHTS